MPEKGAMIIGPREINCYKFVYLEVCLVLIKHDWLPEDLDGSFGVRIRRFEMENDGKKYIRLGDLTLDELAEVNEVVEDLWGEYNG